MVLYEKFGVLHVPHVAMSLKSAPFCYACAEGFLGHMFHEYYHRV